MQVLRVAENWIETHRLQHVCAVEYHAVISRNQGDGTCSEEKLSKTLIGEESKLQNSRFCNVLLG